MKHEDKLLNRIIEGRLFTDKGRLLDELLDNINYENSTNTTEIGNNVEIDGDLKINGGIEKELIGTFIGGGMIYKIIHQYDDPYIQGLYQITTDNDENYICLGYASLEDNSLVDFHGIGYDCVVNRPIIIEIVQRICTITPIITREFTHSILIKGDKGSISFNFNSTKSTIIDSAQDLYSFLSGGKMAVNSDLAIWYVDFKNSITNAVVNGTTTTLTSLIGTTLTFTDHIMVL